MVVNLGLFHAEVTNLRRIFVGNGYTIEFFDRIVRYFLDNHTSNNMYPRQRDSDVYRLVLPYTGEVSDKFRFILRRFANKYNINCTLAFRPFKVSHYFSLKSPVNDLLKSCLVYKYVCPVDPGQIYIGKTKRHFLERIREHGTTETAVALHCDNCGCFSPRNFTVERLCRSDYETTLVEAWYIRKNKPTLNNTLVNSGSNTVLKL